ncbi:hypothetical protein HanXRQr2_Chr02g0059491 [Helianthus annuus]|uniref:Uncharacterized protein n=1 Tax=Helianthus annuus TaxID=4232 RepID=A0A251UWX4_HELAN|nr:hypothetical protein HanXRQr2_Chr02g0059491 [Helianthus annuus]
MLFKKVFDAFIEVRNDTEKIGYELQFSWPSQIEKEEKEELLIDANSLSSCFFNYAKRCLQTILITPNSHLSPSLKMLNLIILTSWIGTAT